MESMCYTCDRWVEFVDKPEGEGMCLEGQGFTWMTFSCGDWAPKNPGTATTPEGPQRP